MADARRGDTFALRALLRALAPAVLRTARRIVAHPADAEDAAQDAMAEIVRALGSLREPEAVVPFAIRVAARIAVRLRERRRRDDERRARLLSESEPWEPARVEEATARRRAELLLTALADLSASQAETLVLRYVAGLEPAEIAAAMGIPVNTVRSRMRLGREALARRLAADPTMASLHEKP